VGADLIIHVRDISHPESDAQAADVQDVLTGLGIGEAARDEMIEVLNKIDLLDAESRGNLRAACSRSGGKQVAISAVEGLGCDELLTAIDAALSATREVVEVTVSPQDGATLAWLYRHGEVLDRDDRDDGAHLKVSLDPSALGRLQKKLQVSRRIG
jgi:GTP-binding protein HflX